MDDAAARQVCELRFMLSPFFKVLVSTANPQHPYTVAYHLWTFDELLQEVRVLPDALCLGAT